MRITTTIVSLAFIVFQATALAGERVNQNVNAPAGGTVSVNNVAGTVRVVGWDREEVRVEGELDERVERLEFENDGEFTRINVIYPRNMRGNGRGSHLNISVPASSRLEVSTVSANADIRNVSGTIRVGTVSGDATVDESSNDYSLETVSGNVRLAGTRDNARVKASSVSGNVHLRDIKGELDASSVSGNVSVNGGTLSRAESGTTSGSVDISAAFSPDGSYRFKSVSGNVVLRFENTPTGSFDVTTFSGGIRNDFGPEPQRTSRYAPGKELKFREGDGKADFRINTLSGEVRLVKD